MVRYTSRGARTRCGTPPASVGRQEGFDPGPAFQAVTNAHPDVFDPEGAAGKLLEQRGATSLTGVAIDGCDRTLTLNGGGLRL